MEVAVNPVIQSAIIDKYGRPFAEKTQKIVENLDMTVEKQDVVVEKQDKLGDKVKEVVSNLEGAGANFSDAFSRSSDGLKELSFGFVDIKGIIETVATKFKALNDVFAPLAETLTFFGSGAFGNIESYLKGEENEKDKQNREFKEATSTYKESSIETANLFEKAIDSLNATIDSFKDAINIFKDSSQAFKDVIDDARGVTRTDTPALTNQSGDIIDAEFEEVRPAVDGYLTDKSQSKRKTNMFGKSIDKTRNIFSGLGKIVGNLTKAFGRLLMASFSIIGSFLSLAAPVVVFGFLLYQVIKAMGGWMVIEKSINFLELQFLKLGRSIAKFMNFIAINKFSDEYKQREKEILESTKIINFKEKRLNDADKVAQLEREYTNSEGILDKEQFNKAIKEQNLYTSDATMNPLGQVVRNGEIIDATTNSERAFDNAEKYLESGGLFSLTRPSITKFLDAKSDASKLEAQEKDLLNLSKDTGGSNQIANINTDASSKFMTNYINNNIGGLPAVSEPYLFN